MLDFNLPEMAVVLIVALVVIGPKDLPKAMRVIGYWVGKARGVARQFRAGFDEMVREAELADMEKKWKEENERIMREHPAAPTAPAAALSGPDDAPDPAKVDLTKADRDEPDQAAPMMVERPVVLPADPAEAEAAPPANPSPADSPIDRAAS